MEIWLIVSLIVFFVLLGGLFAAAELAMVSLRESQLSALEQRGRTGKTVARLARDPNTFLGAVQIGVTVSGFFSAAFGASALAPALSPAFESWGLSGDLALTVAVIVLTLAVAYFSLVFGELAPKRLALQRAETFALFVAPLLSFLAIVLKPLIWLVGKSSDLVVSLFGGDPHKRMEEISHEELITIVETHEGLALDQRSILSDVLEVSNRTLASVLKPRSDVVSLKGSLSVDEAISFAKTQPYSRFPVINKSLDDCTGFVHVRDLVWADSTTRSVASLARSIPIFPSTMGVIPALTSLRAQGQHVALVVDEYGGADGLVTLEDLVEELIGEVYDEHDPADLRAAEEKLDSSSVLPGTTSLHRFEEIAGNELKPGPYSTLAGFIMAELGRIPDVGDKVETDNLTLTVLSVADRRIDKVEWRVRSE